MEGLNQKYYEYQIIFTVLGKPWTGLSKDQWIDRTINADIGSVTAMAIDENEEFLYYFTCCDCQLKRINIKRTGQQPEMVYSKSGNKCYNLAIAGEYPVSYTHLTLPTIYSV